MSDRLDVFETYFQKSLIQSYWANRHIEGLGRSGVQYLPLALDMLFFIFGKML